jgi:phosphoribosylpyrophosphate synthetase
MNRSGHGGNGDLPYPGITKNTCTISENVRGKNILLIDDLYTKTVNIDEDAIQALLDKGARSVVFYAVGKTMSRDFNSN